MGISTKTVTKKVMTSMQVLTYRSAAVHMCPPASTRSRADTAVIRLDSCV